MKNSIITISNYLKEDMPDIVKSLIQVEFTHGLGLQ